MQPQNASAKPRTSAPLKVDLETDQLITQGAHFLGVTKKDLVADAVRMYIKHQREEIRRGMAESMRVLDGTTKARVALLTEISPEDLDRLGGLGEQS
ncbi:hypothetical protein ACIBI4_22420 [Streptomyces sp. NPDC050418]|uniref:hypothetical protein n=1 Tax=Streptomyces sp. NPDC050418 TaxID=3365612 RepID=UPI0037AC0003